VVALSERTGDGRFDDERKLSGHRRIVLRILALSGSCRSSMRRPPWCPGHRPIANRDDLVNFHDTLRTIEGRIQRLVAAGSSVAEILAAVPSAEFDPVWGRGYVTGTVFVSMILAGLGLTEKPNRNRKHQGVSGDPSPKASPT
jgi:hypothetical protein